MFCTSAPLHLLTGPCKKSRNCAYRDEACGPRGGQIVIGLPADPGMFNRLVKNVVTYPKMIRLGIENPRLEYAREHINGVGNLLEMINFHFSADLTNLSYYPFRLASWNLSLGIIVNIELR